MIWRSIKWRLQAWHGLILLGVLAGFGFTAHQMQRANELRRVDQELQQRVSVLLTTLRAGRLPGHPPPGPPAERGGEVPMPPGFRLPPDRAGLFGGDGTAPFYYSVWRRDGKQLDRSTNAPADLTMPERDAGSSGMHIALTRGRLREVFYFTPPGECLLTGRSITPELAGLRRSALGLIGLGAGVLALGLAGGWWLAKRAIRPIDDISAAAAKIATGDLSHRISTTATDNELGHLAGVLNSTFARLEAAFTRQARFTADASHELRTPISVLLSQTQSALARERSGSEYRAALEACQRAAQRMRRLTESLLTLARLDSGEDASTRAACELDRIVSEAVELLRPLAQEQNVTLTVELAPVRCEGNAEQLAQVVSNLVSNAIHYNRSGGRVQVKLVSEPGAAVLSVSDTGQGVAPEDLPHIFERFFRADKARASAAGRTGLGLAITKAIVEGHGGSIVASSQLGSGTTLTVRLPRPAE